MPKNPIADPASLRNQTLPCLKWLFAKNFPTSAAELPAMAIGMQCPIPKQTIYITPVAIW